MIGMILNTSGVFALVLMAYTLQRPLTTNGSEYVTFLRTLAVCLRCSSINADLGYQKKKSANEIGWSRAGSLLAQILAGWPFYCVRLWRPDCTYMECGG